MQCSMQFRWKVSNLFQLCFVNNADEITLTWECNFGYLPDSRVERAWGFCSDDLVTKKGMCSMQMCSVTLARWPPDETV